MCQKYWWFQSKTRWILKPILMILENRSRNLEKIIKNGQIPSLQNFQYLLQLFFYSKLPAALQHRIKIWILYHTFLKKLTRFLPFLSRAPVIESSDNSNQSLILLWWSANRFIAFFDTPSNWAGKKIKKKI